MAINLSKEVENRITIWLFVLQKVCDALVAEEQLWNRVDGSSSSEQWHCYTINDSERSIHLNLAAVEALHTQAVVLFGQIFNSGSAGEGIAGNNSEEVKAFRDKVVTATKAALGWDDAKYTQVFNAIKSKRDQFTAHYDGNAAQYEEDITMGISKMKSPGALFTRDELVDFLPMARTMYDVVRNELIRLHA